MIPDERRKNILISLKENEFMRADELAKKYRVSKITILRDIELLKKQGLIKKVHGAVKLHDSANNEFIASFNLRIKNNYSKKLEIARKTLKFLDGSQTVFLDSSSTIYVLATEIFKISLNEINFVTNSPAIIIEALKYPGINLISTGGELKQEFNIFAGNWVNEFLENINIDCALISAAGISSRGKITTNNKDLSAILSLVFKKSGQIFLLADSTKFFKEGMLDIADLSECRKLITDKNIGKEAIEKIKKMSNVDIVF